MNNTQKGVKTISGWHRDFFASFLRSQLDTLQSVLAEIENSDGLEGGYVEISLKRVEKELYRFRKLYRSICYKNN
ncbi:MAG: hypothetical protein DRP80_07240 [Candidatus Omnitrophota bacterium]|nr:MAG: hypothetical protein DRP80_07240 [Candidatus Omnitrophota bacterium]